MNPQTHIEAQQTFTYSAPTLKPTKKTQCEALTAYLEQGWVTSAVAFSIGISSMHRRLTDIRRKLPPEKYIAEEWRTVETRWGETKIKAYRILTHVV